MIVERIDNYGADADGRRGITVYSAELDDDDIEWVRDEIIAQFIPEKRHYTVWEYCDRHDREFEFEVEMQDYFSESEIRKLENAEEL